MRSVSAAPILLGQPERICVLVVEDEALIRWAIADALRDAGYGVIEAVDGDEALRIIQTGVRLDLVFSDVRMPGSTDGLTLLEAIKTTIPGMPVVITSGHCDPAVALNGGAAHFVRKPYELEFVVALVRDALGNPE